MKAKKTTLRIGEISSGTLKSIDLAESMVYALQSLRLSKSERSHVREAQRSIEAHNQADCGEETAETLNALDYAVNESLFNAMNAHCPPYCYYGTLEGDGSCFGVWPSMDSIQQDMDDGEILNLYGAGEDYAKGYSGYSVEVNDHGNMTLFRYSRGRRRVVWSIV